MSNNHNFYACKYNYIYIVMFRGIGNKGNLKNLGKIAGVLGGAAAINKYYNFIIYRRFYQ
jgi:hypothetical protein